METQGIRSIPTFHIFSGGGQVDVVNGARLNVVEESVRGLLKKARVDLP